MEKDVLIVLAGNIGTIVIGVGYLSSRVARLEKKINNGISEKVASMDTRLNMLWEVCSRNPANKGAKK